MTSTRTMLYFKAQQAFGTGELVPVHPMDLLALIEDLAAAEWSFQVIARAREPEPGPPPALVQGICVATWLEFIGRCRRRYTGAQWREFT